MADRILAKSRIRHAVGFDALDERAFVPLTVGASQVMGTVQDYFAITSAIKILGVAVVASNAAHGLTAFNIVVGTAAFSGATAPASNMDQGTIPPTFASAGQGVFATNPSLTALAAYTGTMFYPTEPDAIYGRGTILTLRYTSGASVNGTLKVTFACIPIDVYPTRPRATAFSYANDCG